MTTIVETLLAREYLRVSFDRTGRQRSVEEQHADNQRVADTQSWKLGQPYADPDVSASRYSKKIRDDFEALLEDLRTGRFGAQILIIWESSRGSRRAGEWVLLVDLLEEAGVKVYVTTHGRLYDPANGRDRRVLLEDAIDSEYESWKISQRVLRDTAAAAAAGAPHGAIPYGYRRVYDPRTRRLVAQEPEPAEAAVIAELYERLDRGESLNSIARTFERAGIRNRKGLPHSANQLRSHALNERYVGVRVHVPVATKKKYRPGVVLAEMSRTEGVWPALVNREIFERVRARLSSPERKMTRPGRGVHLLSMIARCDVCDGPLAARYPKPRGAKANDRDRKRAYVCHGYQHVMVDADKLDRYAEAVAVAFLSEDGALSKIAKANVDSAQVQMIRDELAKTNGTLREYQRMAASMEVDPTFIAGIVPGLKAKIADLEQRERDLTLPASIKSIVEDGRPLYEIWPELAMSARRMLMRDLWTADYLGELRIKRAGTNQHVPVSRRVLPLPRKLAGRARLLDAIRDLDAIEARIDAAGELTDADAAQIAAMLRGVEQDAIS